MKDNPTQADFEKCGLGRGAECCIFFIVGPSGAECARSGDLHYTLVSRREGMIAKRQPTEAFPGCQLEENE